MVNKKIYGNKYAVTAKAEWLINFLLVINTTLK